MSGNARAGGRVSQTNLEEVQEDLAFLGIEVVTIVILIPLRKEGYGGNVVRSMMEKPENRMRYEDIAGLQELFSPEGDICFPVNGVNLCCHLTFLSQWNWLAISAQNPLGSLTLLSYMTLSTPCMQRPLACQSHRECATVVLIKMTHIGIWHIVMLSQERRNGYRA